MKVSQRKQFLWHVLNHMGESTSATELAKQVNILDAIFLLKNAWNAVNPTTIKMCFAKCEFLILQWKLQMRAQQLQGCF